VANNKYHGFLTWLMFLQSDHWRALQIRWNSWNLVLIASAMAGGLFAQQAYPPTTSSQGAQIVRVRTGTSCGMCSGPYYESETSVERGLMVSIHRSRADKRNYPDLKTKYRIAKQDWEELQRAIDTGVLAALTGSIDCPGCLDKRTEWLEVQFGDGTKRSISYNSGSAPPAIAEVLKKISAIKATPLRMR
jgi:hypothetical protein